MTTTTIPASIEDAIAELNGLGALLTAKEWSRAAIVYAFTREGEGQGTRQPPVKSPEVLSFSAFAALGISGLSQHQSVARYHRAWADSGAPPAKPGESVELPSVPWPPDLSGIRSDLRDAAREAAEAEGLPGVGQVGNVLRNPKAVRAAIMADPNLREIAASAAAESYRAEAAKSAPRAEWTNVSPGDSLLPFTLIDGALTTAIHELRDAARKARDSELGDDTERVALTSRVETIKAICEYLLIAINGDTTDWDEAAASLLGEGS